jgi:Domain of unknown function (DUF4258)
VADKPIVLSKHAQDMVDEREIMLQWIEQVLRNPVFEEPDPRHPGAVRACAPITAFGNRKRLREITPVVAEPATRYRNPELRELLLSGLRLATGEGA